MPTEFELRFVPYTPGGAQIAPQLTHSGASFQKPFCDSPTLTSLSVSGATAGTLPTLLELGVEYNAGSGWTEMRGGRFLINNFSSEDTDPTQMQTLSGIGIWEWFLQRAYLNHVAALTVSGFNSEATLALSGIISSGATFTKAGHGLAVDDYILITATGGTPLQKNGYYWVVSAASTTFKVSTTMGGTPRQLGGHSGISVGRAKTRLILSGQPFLNDEKVTVVSTGGSTGVTAGQDYYVTRASSHSIALSSTVNGPSINLAGTTNMILTAAPDGDRRFNAQTPGAIMKLVIDEAVGRGALSPGGTPLTYDFTATTDSNGVAWATTYTLGISPGTTALSVLQLLVKNGWAEYDTSARVLHLYNRGTGDDQTTGGNPVTIGQAAISRPSQTNLDNLLTDVVTADENGKLAASYSATGTLPLGRLESYQTQAGVTDDDTSAAIVESYAQQAAAPVQGWTVTETPFAAAALPEVNYLNGDKIRARFGGHMLGQFVVQIGYRVDAQGIINIDTTLGYRFLTLATKTTRRVVAQTGGKVDTGTGKTIVPWVNRAKPAAPSNMVIASDGAFSGSGAAKAGLAVSWDPVAVTTTGDQVAVTDYEVFVRADGADTPISQGRTGGATSYTTQGSDANTIVAVSVRAINSAGAPGPASDEIEVVSGAPSYVLDPPSVPILTSTLGDLTITWDGDLVGGDGVAAPPPSFAYVKAQLSTSSGGTFSDVGQNLSKAGAIVLTGLLIGSTYWVQLIAVDNLGVESAVSPSQNISVILSANSIKATNIQTGDSNQYAMDGTFENPSKDPNIALWWAQLAADGDSFLSSTQFHSGSQSMYTPATLTSPSGSLSLIGRTADLVDFPLGFEQQQIPVKVGQTLHMDWWDWVDVAGTVPAPLNAFIVWVGVTSSWPSGTLQPLQPTQAGRSWVHHTFDAVVPANTKAFYVLSSLMAADGTTSSGRPSNAFYLDDVSIIIKQDGSTLVSGSVDGSALVPASVTGTQIATAAVGTTQVADTAVTLAKLETALQPLGPLAPTYSAVATFTPTITTAFSVGAGTQTGRHAKVGNIAGANFAFVLGTGFSITDLQVTMPDSLVTAAGAAFTGEVTLVHGSARFVGAIRFVNSTTMEVLAHVVSGTSIGTAALTSSVPFTWASGDQVLINLVALAN